MSDLALTYVEIDVPYCALLYGTTNGAGTCPAVLGVDSAVKCWNTIATCAVPASFTNVPVTLRFAVDTGHNPSDIEALPFIRQHSDVSITPGRISLGEDLGQRESVSITFEDRPHSDTGSGFDKYLSDRTYDPYSQGTFWSKFRARQPYLKGRPVRIYRGFVGQALADMECRHYIVDSYNGPGVDGRYTLVAKDILKLLDGDQAQAPVLSQGSIASDITSGSGSFTLSPTGIGSTYPGSGKLNLGGTEIASFTRSGDIVTLTARGLYNTAAAAHSGGDRAQVCVEYLAQKPSAIVADLMQTYGGVDPSYLPTATWTTETDTFNRRLYTGIVTDPTPVRSLIQEMIVQAGLAIWWDPVLQQVELQVLRAVTADARTFDESNMLAGSFSIAEQPDKRVSQVWVFYGQRNPLAQQDLPANYRSCAIEEDGTAEENYGAPAIQKIYSRWIAFGGLSTAQRIGNLQLGRYVNPPRKFTFDVLKNSTDTPPLLGAGYYLENAELQNPDGSRATVSIQITRIRSDADRWSVEAEENIYVSYDSTDSLTVVIDSAIRSTQLRSLYDSLYSAPQDGDQVTFIINASVLVGANSYAVPAMEVGGWPSVVTTGNRTSASPTLTGIASTTRFSVGQMVMGTGLAQGSKIVSKTSSTITLDANATSGSGTATTITVWMTKLQLDIYGRLQGAGGPGGRGATGNGDIPGQGGVMGGTALYSRVGISANIKNGGNLRSGGGGGGGAGTRVYDNHSGGGGGGGAGDVPGTGGGAGDGNGDQGSTGGLDSGGVGGLSWTTNGSLGAQPTKMVPRGATGGNAGFNGQGGVTVDIAGGPNGLAGYVIDGRSYVALIIESGGAYAGTEVN